MSLTLVGVSTGDPRSVTTQSGVVAGVFDALERLEVRVVRVDASVGGLRKVVCTASCPSLSRDAWRHRLHRGSCATSARTGILKRQLVNVPRIDAVLLVRNTYRPLDQPYMPFLDTTLTLVRREWPPHVPWTARTLQRLIETERVYLRAAMHIFVVGERVAQSVADYGIPSSRITVVGGGANWPVADTTEVGRSDPIALLVGRDFERKGGALLLEAFESARAEIPDARLRIVGDAPSHVPAGVEVLGNITDRDRLRSVYRSARVCVLPARFEPYGLVLTEAMSQGVPCVGTDVGAIGEIIEDGTTGAIIASGDVEGLTRALSRYLGDVSLAERHGEAARQRVATQLTWDHVAQRIVASATRALNIPDARTTLHSRTGSSRTHV